MARGDEAIKSRTLMLIDLASLEAGWSRPLVGRAGCKSSFDFGSILSASSRFLTRSSLRALAKPARLIGRGHLAQVSAETEPMLPQMSFGHAKLAFARTVITGLARIHSR